MSNIENVIERARQPGGFSEHRQFTVARERAIRKMREFALADPHFYILELIQAAVANGADHVNIDCRTRELQFSYIGGGYAQEELAQLFDFLFSSKEDLEHSDIRQLAVGINALMNLKPNKVIIESGEGTLSSTERIVIREDENTVEVGTPEEALRGTFIRAEGLQRGAISDKSNLSAREYGPPECAAIEERCLAAPVPIIVNNEPVFGYKAVRTPVIFGYDDVVTFDEGDLYGSIGIPEHRHKRSFKVLTWGCWIESTEAAKMNETPVGGVICYDRLNKTADHSGLVRDEQFEEMWARIRPYARQAVEGRAGEGNYRIQRLDGRELPAGQLREFFRGHDRIVVIPKQIRAGTNDGEVAARIGDAIEAPVLRVAEDAFESVAVLSGEDCDVLRPNLDAPGDVSFYESNSVEPPERPWLAGEVGIDDIDAEALGEMLVSEESVAEETVGRVVEQIGTRQPVRGTIYTPSKSDVVEELYVRILTLDRVVWEGSVRSPFPGHVLDVRLPAMAPSLLRAASGIEDATLAECIARVVSRQSVDTLQTATRRALEGLAMRDEQDSPTGRRIALAALGRSALKRLRRKSADEREPGIHFSLVRPQPGPDLLSLELFEALDGTTYSLRDLEALMEETSGLVYGVVPEVEPDLDGLDKSRILALDLERERQLLTIVGDAAYVRLDRRDVLAQTDGLQVRDVAIGLRDYPDFPLLVEGGDPSGLDDSRRDELVGTLIDQLRRVYSDADGEPALRREAVRHLQWFICKRHRSDAKAPTYGVQELPLFLNGRGMPVSFDRVRKGFETNGALDMIDGRSSDVCELGSLTGDGEASRHKAVEQLTMNTWVFPLLSGIGEIRSAFEFDFTDGEAEKMEATPEDAYLVDRRVDDHDLEGRIGIPAFMVEQPAVAVIDEERQKAYRMRQPAVRHGVTGFVRIRKGDIEERWDEISMYVADEGADMIGDLLDELPGLGAESSRFERAFDALFGFAARHLQLTRRPDGTVASHIEHPLAQKILELPVFPTATGNPVSALRLIGEFCVSEGPREAFSSASLRSDLPKPLQRWLERHLSPSNIVEPADQTAAGASPASEADSFAERVSAWLEELRPDDFGVSANRGGKPSPSPARQQRWTIHVETSGRDGSPRLDASTPCQFVANPSNAPYPGPILWLNADNPLVRRASEPSNREDFAWLLLTCYAHINDLVEPVTNDHELEFQRRITDFMCD